MTYSQILLKVEELPQRDKEKLFYALRAQRFEMLLKKFRKSASGFPFGFDEIIKETEAVRSERYAKKKK